MYVCACLRACLLVCLPSPIPYLLFLHECGGGEGGGGWYHLTPKTKLDERNGGDESERRGCEEYLSSLSLGTKAGEQTGTCQEGEGGQHGLTYWMVKLHCTGPKPSRYKDSGIA